MNTIFVEPDKQEKYYLPLECIYLLFQVSIGCLQFIFNGSRGDCSVWISIEENWWICYHIGTCSFLEYKLPTDVEFNVFAFTTMTPRTSCIMTSRIRSKIFSVAYKVLLYRRKFACIDERTKRIVLSLPRGTF